MGDASLKNKVMHSLKWVAMGKVFTQAIRWITTFWVLRMLVPEDYALVAMSDVFSGFLTLFTGAMFTASIIKDQELTTEKLKKVFGLIILFHAFLFTLQIGLAVPMGLYYQEPKVTDILYVNAVILLVNIIGIVPQALLTKEMAFKATSVIGAVANITAAICTLVMAYNDFGFWALIIGEIIGVVIKTLLVLTVKPVFLRPDFRVSGIGSYIKFGSMLSLHVALFYILLHLDVFVAGRALSLAEVGFYAVATQIALMPQRKLLPLLKQVAFPAFSSIQDDDGKVGFYVHKAQRLCFLVTIPVFWGLASVVDTLIPVVLGEKWESAVIPTMIILSIMPLRFSEELFGPALKSRGEVNHMLINVLITLGLLVFSLYFTLQLGAVGLALAWAIAFPLAYSVIFWRNCRLLNIKKGKLLKSFATATLCGLLMVAGVYMVKHFVSGDSITNLLLYIGTGALAFAVSTLTLNRHGFTEVTRLFRR